MTAASSRFVKKIAEEAQVRHARDNRPYHLAHLIWRIVLQPLDMIPLAGISKGNHLWSAIRVTDDTVGCHRSVVTRDKENPLDPVNDLCALLLRSHSGFDRGMTQGYLDLFSVAVNEPRGKMAKAAMLLDRAMRFPKTIRFRDYYNVSPSSGDRGR